GETGFRPLGTDFLWGVRWPATKAGAGKDYWRLSEGPMQPATAGAVPPTIPTVRFPGFQSVVRPQRRFPSAIRWPKPLLISISALTLASPATTASLTSA